MDQQLIALYHRHVAPAFDRQLRFNGFLERKAPGADWVYDSETATLAFGKLKFEAPVVGSHAEHNNSWLWAWSNKHLKLTVTNRALGDTVRMLVHRLGVHALAAPGFSLEPLLGTELTEDAAHVLGMILSRELDYSAYFLTPYDGGTGLTLIRDKRLAFTERRPLARIMTVFPQVVDALTVFDHRIAFTNYALSYGLSTADVPGGVRVRLEPDELVATFDDRNRLIELRGTVAAEQPRPVRSAARKGPVKRPARQSPRRSAKKPAKKPMKRPPRKPVRKAGKKKR
jgi:uncharacterized protein DUF6882